jgi:DNA invertase Pin-like site-specific DNA recombinase
MRPKIDRETADEIRRLYRAGTPGKALAFRFSISKSTVSTIIRNKIWKDAQWQAELSSFDPRSPTRAPGAGTVSWFGNRYVVVS